MKKKKSSPHDLNVLSEKEIREAFEVQEKVGWTFYSEREFLENAVSQQVNFVVTAFSIFIAAAATLKDDIILLIVVFALGTILIWALNFSVYRIYKRWDIVLKILYKIDEKHVLPMVQREIISLGKKASTSTIWWRAVGIPRFCLITMILGFICSLGYCVWMWMTCSCQN